MNRSPIHTFLQRLVAEAIPPAEVDLWSAIRSRYETRKAHPKGVFLMKTSFAHHRRLVYTAISILVVVLVAALLLLTPQGRAWAQYIFFTRSDSDTLPLQPWQLTPLPGTPTPDPGFDNKDLTITEAEGLAGYHVLEPTGFNEILTFVGASFDPQHNIVRIFYANGFVLRQERYQISADCELCNSVGASAPIETVQIGDVTGEYVVGVWKLTDNGPVWEPEPLMQRLRWQANGMAFELMYNPPTEDKAITKSTLIAIAESIR